MKATFVYVCVCMWIVNVLPRPSSYRVLCEKVKGMGQGALRVHLDYGLQKGCLPTHFQHLRRSAEKHITGSRQSLGIWEVGVFAFCILPSQKLCTVLLLQHNDKT